MPERTGYTAEAGQNTQNDGERTFSQEEVNAIVGKRIAEVKNQYADFDTYKDKALKYDQEEEAKKSEIQKANERADALQKKLDDIEKAEAVRSVREKVAAETGVPANLLTSDNEDECKKQAEAIRAYAGTQPYPTVKDGGEHTRTAKRNAADAFGEWFNSQMKN